ncbi:MAG: helix-turn-helix domain-containing protein [Candidatus Brevundimonas phytovorans]|nr:helix-turn-helix domain-containing protein [Brevundimonas sp.]WEK59408.1 MAG: helix-turn-helix domain-containing protein [Brevundimonas sp.]
MSAANDNKLAYSPAEAAEALGVGRSTIFDLMKNGQLRRVKIGAKTVIPRSSLEALLAETPDAA